MKAMGAEENFDSKIKDHIVIQITERILKKYENEIRSHIDKTALKNFIDRSIELKKCPLLSKPNWDNCGDMEKGGTEFCFSSKYLNCPAFDRYVAHEIVEKPRRQKIKAEKEKGGAKKKK